MKNTYLEILELTPGASKSDIKKAYRRLSKKYHPDVNKSSSAEEQFIKINEAYKFLMEVGPKPHAETISYDYDPQVAEFEERRRRARAYAAWKRKEEEKRRVAAIKYLLYWFDFVAIGIIIFNAVLLIDYYLPLKAHNEEIISISRGVEGSRRNSRYRYDDIQFKNFKMRLDKGEVIHLKHYEEAIVFATPILFTPIKCKITSDGITNEHIQIYGLYRVFIFIIPAMFIIAFLYEFIIKSVDNKITLAILMCIIEIIQVYLFFDR